MPTWTPWRPYPDPRNGGILHAPIGPGVYDLRRISTKEPVLFGIGARCAHRMTSLLPAPFGCGTRNNQDKRKYLLRHLHDIEYRTLPCQTRTQAADIERRLKADNPNYHFKT